MPQRLTTAIAMLICTLAVSGPVQAVITLSHTQVTDVTSTSFSVVWHASEVSVPRIAVYSDAAGTQEITDQVEAVPYPLQGAGSGFTTAYEQAQSRRALRQAAQQKGLSKVQVRGLTPGTDYYFKAFAESDTDSGNWPAASLEQVTTELENSFIIDSLVAIINTNDNDAAGWLVTVSAPTANYPVSSFIGAGAEPGKAVLNLGNLFGADGFNWTSATTTTVTFNLISETGEIVSATGDVDLSALFAVASLNDFEKNTADQLPPILTIQSPSPGTVTNIATLVIAGTATDSGQGDSGIKDVTINSVSANNATASGADTASWSLDVGGSLILGPNQLNVVAIDDSFRANETTDSVTVVYLPEIVDANSNGLPDVWESANGIINPFDDSDLDDITDFDEYMAGTNPQAANSKPEGANGINYVYFRDHFNDSQYDDRWYIASMDVNTDATLSESGSVIQAAMNEPASACTELRYESFGVVDAVNAVYRATLQIDGAGHTKLGLMNDLDRDNRIEFEFDTQSVEPAFSVNSVDNAAVTSIPPANDVFDAMNAVNLRVTKADDEYRVYVNGNLQAVIINSGLGDTSLRPYVTQYSCATNSAPLDTSIDLIELLLDRDADGRADLYEDANVNGSIDSDESDPLDPDTDGDSTDDGYDNCLVASNADQRDTDGDGYGNLCDADFNNDGFVTVTDFLILRDVLNTTDSDADLNGDGFVTVTDFLILRSQLNQAPGPSGLISP